MYTRTSPHTPPRPRAHRRAGRVGVLLLACAACALLAAIPSAAGSASRGGHATPASHAAGALGDNRGAIGRAAGATPIFGLADYEPRSFSDPRVAELGVRYARDVVSWNVALVPYQLAQVRAWLQAVRKHGITPLITFQHAVGNDRAPTPARYLAAFLRFHQLFPWVHEFTPWDEATHATQPTEHRPGLAAAYYNALASHCRGCVVTAPDILDSDGNFERWIAQFARRARPYPQIWPFNPYHSASVDSATLLERFLAATHGQVWFGEVGGVVWWRLRAKLIYHGVQYAAGVAKNIFSLARLSPRITRIYYYHWRSPGSPRHSHKATWDAGLVSASGAARPALWVVAKELHRHLQRSIPKVY
ncbi:MAG TPA: hypothetical protein VNV42_15315 [Solirubrobacteraceae bacterium]|jgi:hypothetical protein|nr:hypothetical protein [Solirubrobacteraceae bacterium]